MTIELPHYVTLGVPRTANQAEIRSAYRRLARTAHPDAGGDPDEFIRLTSAYNTLSDPDLRRQYDLTGDDGAEDPMKFQEFVIGALGELLEACFEMVDKAKVDPDSVGFMQTMRNMASAKADEFTEDYRSMTNRMSIMEKFTKKIRRKGEEENIYETIVSKKVDELSSKIKENRRNYRMSMRVIELLNDYEDISSVIRTVQAGRYYAETSAGFTFFSNITPT